MASVRTGRSPLIPAVLVLALAVAFTWYAPFDRGRKVSSRADTAAPAPERTTPNVTVSPEPARSAPAASSAPRTVRNLPMDPLPPAASVVARIEALNRSLQAGDTSAAYSLFSLLEHCQRAPHMAATLRSTRSDTPESAVHRVEEGLIAEAELLDRECATVPRALVDRRLEFLELAATWGDIRARVDFGAYAPEYFASTQGLVRNAEKVVEFKAKTMAYLHSAAENGAPLALLKLAGLYREGVMVEGDSVTALAYYLAWDQVGGSAGGVDPYRQQREWGMSATQLNQARELQRQIVARCCRQ